MSVINNALSELSKKETPTSIEAAVIPPVKTRSPWVWIAAGFAISLTVGGWAISQSPSINYTSEKMDSTQNQLIAGSETVVSDVTTPVIQEEIEPASELPNTVLVVGDAKPAPTEAESQPINNKAIKTEKLQVKSVSHQATNIEKHTAPILVAKLAKKEPEQVKPSAKTEEVQSKSVNANTQSINATPTKSMEEPANASSNLDDGNNVSSSIVIEQVELTPDQLAKNAIGRAKKALDGNDLLTALTSYTEALRYTPRNEDVRQKLAILYFGKGDTRKAYELLQTGIRLNTDSEGLRLGLSKLLIKANQSEAALSPLVHLPPSPTKDYLSMRAALSQKAQQEQMALESYQKLVKLDGDNARWWLGLGIQQERQFDLAGATHSYQQALVRVGISSQSQSFVRDRLKILKDLEGTTSAN